MVSKRQRRKPKPTVAEENKALRKFAERYLEVITLGEAPCPACGRPFESCPECGRPYETKTR